MKFTHLFIILLFLSFTGISCEKLNKDSIKDTFDCEFVQNDDDMDGLIDDEEKELMQDCNDNAYDSIDDIENNLEGDWILVGHGEGWFAKTSQPCAYVIFDDQELTFKFENATIDTIITTTWEIEETTSPSWSDFRIKTDSDVVDNLRITHFSPSLMYGDYTPVDGNMYLFKKVK